MLDVALDGTYAHRGGDKGILDELAVDLGGVEAGKCLLEPVDLLNGRIRERAGGALVRAFCGHEGVDAAPLILGHPAGNGVGAVPNCAAVRQREGLFRDALIIGVPGRVWIELMDHRGDDGKPELSDSRRFSQRRRFFHGQDLLILVCSSITHRGPGWNSGFLWLAPNVSALENGAVKKRRVPMPLKKGPRRFLIKQPAKIIGIIRQTKQCLDESGRGRFIILQHTQPNLFVR